MRYSWIINEQSTIFSRSSSWVSPLKSLRPFGKRLTRVRKERGWRLLPGSVSAGAESSSFDFSSIDFLSLDLSIADETWLEDEDECVERSFLAKKISHLNKILDKLHLVWRPDLLDDVEERLSLREVEALFPDEVSVFCKLGMTKVTTNFLLLHCFELSLKFS